MHMCQGAHLEGRGQLLEAGSMLPPCEAQGFTELPHWVARALLLLSEALNAFLSLPGCSFQLWSLLLQTLTEAGLGSKAIPWPQSP